MFPLLTFKRQLLLLYVFQAAAKIQLFLNVATPNRYFFKNFSINTLLQIKLSFLKASRSTHKYRFQEPHP